VKAGRHRDADHEMAGHHHDGDHDLADHHDQNCDHVKAGRHRDADHETVCHHLGEARADRRYLVNRRSGVGLSPCWGGLGCSDGVQT